MGYDEEQTLTVHRVRLPVSELEIGMYVCELDRPWLESPFLFQGFELKTEADIMAVQEVCGYVFVDFEKSTRPAREHFPTGYSKDGEARGASRISKPPPRRVSVEKEFGSASLAYRQTSDLVKTLMDDVRLGNRLDMDQAKEAVTQCVQSILRNPDALMLLTMIKNKDEYTSQHSINVSLYSIALGRHLNFPFHELERLGLCGMMHDIGKLRVPLHILNKPEKLTADESDMMMLHPIYGREILVSTQGIDPAVVDVAYAHHERVDGHGYPRGIDATSLTPYVKMVAIVDTYDAVTSDRIYQQGKTHMDGINLLTRERGKAFDGSLVVSFIECLGIFPPGTVVEMNNGEVGLVVETNPDHKIRPKMLLLLDETKRPQRPRLIDLAKLDLDASGRPYRIKSVLRSDAYGINLRQFQEKGVIGKVLAA